MGCLDGNARVVADPDERAGALAALVAKFQQYVNRPPADPVLALDITGWVGRSAAS